MRILRLLIFPILLLAACSNETPAITKIESAEENPDQTPALIENQSKVDEENQVEMLIEFNLPNEQVIINLDQVTILKQYLASVNNKAYVINKMHLSHLNIEEYHTLYLLQFSCEQDACSYLLLDQKDEGRSYLLEDLTKVRQVIPSPDKEKLLFIFERKQADNESTLNKLMVMDIDNWKVANLLEIREVEVKDNEIDNVIRHETENYKQNFIDFNTYQVPIEEVVWKDNESILVSLPFDRKVKQPEKENESNKKIVEIKLED